MSTFVVLHKSVTLAPNDLAICTANMPTPPAARYLRRFGPGWIRRLSRGPSNAVSAGTGAEAACSKVTLCGLMINADFMPNAGLEVAYSAKPKAVVDVTELHYRLQKLLSIDRREASRRCESSVRVPVTCT
jgi:hypothetical protein